MSDDFPTPGFRQRASTRWLLAGGVLVAAGAFWAWQAINALQAREAELREQLAAVTEREATLAAQGTELAQSLGALSSGQSDVSKRLDGLYGARRSALLVAESEHLARLAAQRLALMQDPAGAVALLSAADAALKDVRDMDTHAARAAIAGDIRLLREAAAVDVESLYLRLAALPPQVDVIASQPVGDRKPAATPAVPPIAEPAVDGDLGWWQRMGRSLMSLVTIRRVDAPLTPMVTEGERALAAQNFRLLVEQAQVALLQRRGNIYLHSLDQADRWLTRVAGGEPARRNAVHRELASLRVISVGNQLPDLTASLTATRALAARALPESGDLP